MLYTHGHENEVTLAQLADYAVPTLEELQEKKGPNAGSRWSPIHHGQLIDNIHTAALARGLEVDTESFVQSDDGHDIYGNMQFKGVENFGRSDMAPVLGFRSSNMQRFALRGVSGSRVFICENGAIIGDFVFGMKHTKGKVGELQVGIDEGLDTWEDQIKRMDRVVTAMESMQLTESDADHILMQAARDKVFAISKVGRIDAQYRDYQNADNPHSEAFAPRTAWSLYNAVTEIGKGLSMHVSENALKGFPRTLARIGGFDALLDAPVDEASGLVLN